MPLLGFSVLKEKLLDRSKCQTIRLPRKRPVKVGDKVYLYWHLRQRDCQKLGEGIVTSVVRKQLHKIDLEDAYKDGFTDTKDYDAGMNLRLALAGLHKDFNWQTQFDIISWKWLS